MEYGVDHDVGPVPGYVVPTPFSKDRHAVWGSGYELSVRAMPSVDASMSTQSTSGFWFSAMLAKIWGATQSGVVLPVMVPVASNNKPGQSAGERFASIFQPRLRD
jgi:hypothetical protein